MAEQFEAQMVLFHLSLGERKKVGEILAKLIELMVTVSPETGTDILKFLVQEFETVKKHYLVPRESDVRLPMVGDIGETTP